ncbi:MAG: hypothetical protein AAGA27_01235 [Pseudomonadota bacterium]
MKKSAAYLASIFITIYLILGLTACSGNSSDTNTISNQVTGFSLDTNDTSWLSNNIYAQTSSGTTTVTVDFTKTNNSTQLGASAIDGGNITVSITGVNTCLNDPNTTPSTTVSSSANSATVNLNWADPIPENCSSATINVSQHGVAIGSRLIRFSRTDYTAELLNTQPYPDASGIKLTNGSGVIVDNPITVTLPAYLTVVSNASTQPDYIQNLYHYIHNNDTNGTICAVTTNDNQTTVTIPAGTSSSCMLWLAVNHSESPYNTFFQRLNQSGAVNLHSTLDSTSTAFNVNEAGYYLYAGGGDDFSDKKIFYVWRWDGSSWSNDWPIGNNQFDGNIMSLITNPAGVLYLGLFTPVDGSNVKKLIHGGWSRMGDIGGAVYKLLSDKNGTIYAGTLTDGNLVLQWSPSENKWIPLGTGAGCLQASDLIIDNSGNIYITCAPSFNVNHIEKFNVSTQTWSAFSKFSSSPVTLIFDQKGTLYVGGTFQTTDGGTSNYLNYIAKASTTDPSTATWLPVGHGFYGASTTSAQQPVVKTLAMNSHGIIFAGGAFNQNNDGNGKGVGAPLYNVAQWDATNKTWLPIGNGLNNFVRVLYFDTAGHVYAGGVFSENGNGAAMQKIAVYKNGNWQTMGFGSITPEPNASVIRTMTSNAPLVLSAND